MAFSINTTTVSGRLTRDAKVSDYGKTTFSVAVDKRVKKGDKWESATNYFDIEAWRQPQFINDSLRKGVQVVVSGSLDSYTHEVDGQKRTRVFIRADILQVFGNGNKTSSEKQKAEQNDDFDPMWDMEDDIP